MENKSLKNCSDCEIHQKIDQAFDVIRRSPDQYGIIKIEMSGGKIKFITVEKPIK